MGSLTWDSVVPLYLASLSAAGRRAGTIRLHNHYLRHLRRFTPAPTRLSVGVLERALSVRGWSPETLRSASSTYRGFTRWMHARGYLADDPGRLLPAVPVPAGVPRPIPDAILEDLLAGLPPGRDRWLLLLGGHAGLRVGEMATVATRDLDGDLLYVVGKGGRQRIVPLIDDDLVAAIRSARGWLLPGRTDGHLSAGHVSVLLSRLLPAHWTAHTLRHRAGTAGYAATRDILAVGAFLGHSKPETTQRYVQLPPDALRAVARAAA